MELEGWKNSKIQRRRNHFGDSLKVLGTIKFGKNETKQNKSTIGTKRRKKIKRGKRLEAHLYISVLFFTYFDQRF